jgi:hypothetical protein
MGKRANYQQVWNEEFRQHTSPKGGLPLHKFEMAHMPVFKYVTSEIGTVLTVYISADNPDAFKIKSRN